MPPLEEQESSTWPLDLEQPPPTPGPPPIHAHHDSNMLAVAHDNQSGSDDTALKEDSRRDNIKPDVLDPFGNLEVENNIQDAELSKEIREYDITGNQYADLEPESRDEGDSTSFGELSPASKRILQKPDLTVSMPSPEINSRFIQRYDSNEDVMEEIKSAFKFAKKENAQCLDKTPNTKSNGHVSDISNYAHMLKPDHSFLKHRNTFSLPLRLTSNLTNDESPDVPNLLKDSIASMPRHNTSPSASIVNANTPFPPTFEEHQSGISQASVSQENIRESSGAVNKNLDYSDFAPSYQAPTFLKEGGADSLQIKSLECPNQSVVSANTAVSRISQAIATPDTNPRRSQIFQKATPNNRIRIKQPFPEVAQTSSSRSHQSSTQAPNQNHGQCERYCSKPTTIVEPSVPEIDTNCQPVSAIPIDNDMSLHPRSSSDCLDFGVSKSQISPHQNFALLSNAPLRPSPLSEEAQGSNTELASNGEEVNELARDSTLYKSASHNQQNRAEELQKNIQVSNSQERDSTDPNISEAMAIGGVATNYSQSDNLLPTSESQVPVKPATRPSSSQSQQQSHGINPLMSLSNDVSDTFGHLQQASEPGLLQYNNDARVKKSKFIHNHRREIHRYSSPPTQHSRFLSKVAQAQQSLIQHNQEVEDILDDCQRQKEIIQSQQSELEKLKTLEVEKSGKIQALELEKKAQKAKIKKFEQLSSKYKDHMNEVVISQKQLLRESQRIRKVETDAKVFQEAYITREAHIQKLACLLDDVKEFRAPAEKLLAAQQENGELIKLVQESSKTNKLLQSDLDKNVIELGRERHAVSQLQKQLNAQTEAHKELIEHLKNTRSGIIDDLTRESGILARILYSESSAQEKLEQLVFSVNDMKSHEQDFQPTLVKLIESLSLKFGNMLQTAENNSEMLRESNLKHFIDLKERVDQARLDQKTEGQLNDVITRLRETNATLSSSLSAREDECKGMRARVVDLESDLTGSRSQLSTKYDELAVALALPKDDPKLREICHDLERRNIALESQIDITTRETTSTKEQLAVLRKDLLETEKQFHQLQDGYNEAQNSLKKLAEEKNTYLSNAKLDIEKARQDVAKSSMAAKNELIMRNEALVKNLEQRRSEAESQVTQMNDELQRMQAEKETYAASTAQMLHEISALREKAIEQSMHIERLEMQSITHAAFEQQEMTIECARGEISELKARLEHVKNNATEDLNAAVQMSKEIEHHLRQVDDLKHENETLKSGSLILQEKYDALRISTSQSTEKSNIPNAQEEGVTTVRPSLEIGQPSCAGQANEKLNFDHPRENPGASSSLKLPYKTLKVANRRTSQSNKVGLVSDQDATAYNVQQSTVMHTSHTTHETTIRVQTPGEEIIPFSNFSPIQSHPPSSLTDVSPIMDRLEVINNQQDLRKVYAAARGNKHCGSPGYIHASRNTDIFNLSENSPPETTRSQYKPSYQHPNGNDKVAGVTRTSNEPIPFVRGPQQKPLAVARKGPVPRKTSTALKSALKQPTNVIKSTNDLATVSKPTTVLKNMPSGRGVNKNQRPAASELGYKRVASGQVIKPKGDNAHFNDMFHGGINAHHHPSQYQSISGISEKSPLMPGPRRNERKRSASVCLGGEQAPKLSKAPRTSLHFKSATTIIPNSQGDDAHTLRIR